MLFRRGKSIVSTGLVAARERCILVFGVITTTSCRMGTLVRPREAYARVEYVGAALVSRRSILDIVDDELRLTKVCSCGVSQFPSASRPLRYPLSRLTPQPPGNVRWRSVRGPRRNGSAPPGPADSYRLSTVGLILTESRAQRLNRDRRTCRRHRRASAPNLQCVCIVGASELRDTSLRPE
jgi:hypothetical protein